MGRILSADSEKRLVSPTLETSQVLADNGNQRTPSSPAPESSQVQAEDGNQRTPSPTSESSLPNASAEEGVGLSPARNHLLNIFFNHLVPNPYTPQIAGQPITLDLLRDVAIQMANSMPNFFSNSTNQSQDLFALLNQERPMQANIERQQQYEQLREQYLLELQKQMIHQQEHDLALQLHHQQQQHKQQQQQQQQQNTKGKKRSYPCSFQWCMECNKEVHSSKLPCHIRQVHVAQPMFLCPYPKCTFNSTYSKNNVKSHMVSVHGLSADPISHMEEYAEEVERWMRKCFPDVRGRGRPIHGNGQQSPASSSSSKSTELYNARRDSAGSISSTNSTTHQRYTHSHRRKGGKHPAQQPVEDLADMIRRKRIKFANLKNDSSLASSNPTEHALNGTDGAPSATSSREQFFGSNSSDTSADNINNATSVDATVTYGNSIDSLELANHDIAAEANQEAETNKIAEASEMNADAEEVEQQLRTGENIQPRYFPQQADWQVLKDYQVKGTIFDTFQPREILDKFSRQPFDDLVHNAAFATEEQLQRVAQVRGKIPLDMSQIGDALNSLNLDALPIEQVDLIASIAPSLVDRSRWLRYEHADPTAVDGENEKFLLMLAKIDHLEEKLHAMLYMGHYQSRSNELLRKYDDLTNAAKLLRDNEGFRTLLKIVVIYSNFIVGDFQAAAFRGFRASALMQMCSVEVCSTPRRTLLDVVVSTILTHFPEVSKFRDTLPALEKAARVNFQELPAAIRRLVMDYLRFVMEASVLKEQRILCCKDAIERKLREVQSGYDRCKMALTKTMCFFGEPVNEEDGPESPETFFANIAAFCRRLRMASIEQQVQAVAGQSNGH